MAGRAGALRIRDNFGGRTPRWNRDGIRKEGDDFIVVVNPREVIEATLDRPASPAVKPVNAAEPVVIQRRPSVQ